MAYDLTARAKPRWQACGRGRFEFVNTRPVAPSHAEFAAGAQISNAATEALFREFVYKTGPYDVIHFHGLEGLPARVLALRKDLPNTRFRAVPAQLLPVLSASEPVVAGARALR